MNKRLFLTKTILDTVMLFVLAILFKKNVWGMTFHEIVGLSIIGVFVIHLLLNRRWVGAITAGLFTKKTTIRAKICWLIDAALAVCFILIALSGIFMSKVLFHLNVGGNWKTLHYFCAALSLILVGIHLGMHGAVIGHSIARSMKKIPPKVSGIIMGIISLIIIISGIYNLNNTSFTRWISMPFETHSEEPEGMKYMQNKSDTTENTTKNESVDVNDGTAKNEDADVNDGTAKNEDVDVNDGTAKNEDADVNDGTAKNEDADANDGTAKNEDADANDNTAMNNDAEGEHKNMTDMAHGKMQVNQSLGSRIGSTFITFFQFFSIMFLFAVITCVVDLLFIVKGHKLHHKIK